MLPFANLNKREKITFLLTIAVIAFSLVYNLVLMPYSRKVAILDRDIAQLQNKLAKAKRLIPKKTRIENDYEAMAVNFKSEEGLSQEQQIARILVEIEKLGNVSGARIVDVKPRPVKKFEYYSEFIIEMRFEGSIKDIARFIYDIQQSKELLRIEKLAVNIKSSEATVLEGFLEIHKGSI